MSGGAVYDQGGGGDGGSKFPLVREGWLRERLGRSGVCVRGSCEYGSDARRAVSCSYGSDERTEDF